jgi:hypothetical protein
LRRIFEVNVQRRFANIHAFLQAVVAGPADGSYLGCLQVLIVYGA